MLIQDLLSFYPSLIRAIGSLIATNIGDLVTDQRAARLEAYTFWRRKEDKGLETLLGDIYGSLLNFS